MTNPDLAVDYLSRARIRLRALDLYFEAESWPDVVRESQEVVELALKGLLRWCGVDPPRIHDVSAVLLRHKDLLPLKLGNRAREMARISRELRRDRELSFYGAEDLTPREFYHEEDAVVARDGARRIVELVYPVVCGPSRKELPDKFPG